MQEFMEELFASNNQNYLVSIKEARADYQAGHVTDPKKLTNINTRYANESHFVHVVNTTA